MSRCIACGKLDHKEIFYGPIRIGKFGQQSSDSYKVLQCDSCKLAWIQGLSYDTASYYEEDDYRASVDEGVGSQDFYEIHDKEQLPKLTVLQSVNFRNKSVVDVGSGAGSFLDFVKGLCSRTVAIEPFKAYHQELQSKGHSVYSYLSQAIQEDQELDIATSFSVIEHVEDPETFVSDIYQVMAKNGLLCMSTPNIDDILFDYIREDYAQFFFRKAHLFYFSKDSLRILLERAGFKDIEIIAHHRFGLSNFMNWLNFRQPMGNRSSQFITQAMDQLWSCELEQNFRSDYLYVIARK